MLESASGLARATLVRLRCASGATTGTHRMLARLMGITGLTGSRVVSSSAPARGFTVLYGWGAGAGLMAGTAVRGMAMRAGVAPIMVVAAGDMAMLAAAVGIMIAATPDADMWAAASEGSMAHQLFTVAAGSTAEVASTVAAASMAVDPTAADTANPLRG